MTGAFGIAVVVSSAVAAAAVLAVGLRHGALGSALAVGVAGGAAVWALGMAMAVAGWRDVDGWIDCHPYCDGWHRLGAFLFWAPPLFVVPLVVGSVVAAAARRALARRRAGPR